MKYTALLTPIEDIGCLLLSARPTAQTRGQIWSWEQRLMRWRDGLHQRQQVRDRKLAAIAGGAVSAMMHAAMVWCLLGALR